MNDDATSTGRLIVFEGPDGVGKSTVSTAVVKYLETLGERSVLITFRGRQPGTLGKLVYDIHHEPTSFGLSGITEASRQTLHVAAHLDAIERLIVPTLESRRHVLLDRYWWSTSVYGLVGGIDRGLLRSCSMSKKQNGEISDLRWLSSFGGTRPLTGKSNIGTGERCGESTIAWRGVSSDDTLSWLWKMQAISIQPLRM